MRKRKGTRKYKVKAQVHNIDLTKAGSSVLLEVYAAGEKIGTAEIGRGSFRWYGKGKQKAKRISWSKLADWMEAP